MFRTALSWTAVVAPPLMLLPLVVIPFDLLLFPFWGIGIVAMLVSFWHIVYQMGRKYRAAIHSRQYGVDGKGLLRPFLTIAVMLIAFVSLSVSWNTVRAYALKVAEEVQLICIKKGECPEDIPGWTKDGSKYVSFAGPLMRFPVFYRPTEDRKAFALYVRWHIDSQLVVTGGVNSQLKSEDIERSGT